MMALILYLVWLALNIGSCWVLKPLPTSKALGIYWAVLSFWVLVVALFEELDGSRHAAIPGLFVVVPGLLLSSLITAVVLFERWRKHR